jgi:hypothetical protein
MKILQSRSTSGVIEIIENIIEKMVPEDTKKEEISMSLE